MRVFICWSGKASHKVAEAVKTFLEDTIQEVKPFLSSESIQKGGRWLTDISGQLSACNFGILCMTKENLNSRWLLFEAGALSKDSAEGRVSALLTGVEASDVESPLSQFQHTASNSEDVLKLLQSINSLVPEANRRSDAQLLRAFDKSWPDLERELEAASKLKSPKPEPAARDNDSIMKEMLELLRGLARDAEAAKQPIGFPYITSSQISPALLEGLKVGTGRIAPLIYTTTVPPGASLLDTADTDNAAGTQSKPKTQSASKPRAPIIKPLKT